MIVRKKHLNWLATLFFCAIIAVVFQQVYTSMTEQGIASGGPYDNGAAYPQAVAIFIAVLLSVQVILGRISKTDVGSEEQVDLSELRRPLFLLILFGVYLGFLGWLGYHLTTAVMIFSVMALCGMRRYFHMAVVALVISFLFAFSFEYFLKIVLPGGVFGLNIPW